MLPIMPPMRTFRDLPEREPSRLKWEPPACDIMIEHSASRFIKMLREKYELTKHIVYQKDLPKEKEFLQKILALVSEKISQL